MFGIMTIIHAAAAYLQFPNASHGLRGGIVILAALPINYLRPLIFNAIKANPRSYFFVLQFNATAFQFLKGTKDHLEAIAIKDDGKKAPA